MSNHLLIEKSFTYPLPRKAPNMEGCFFDDIKGYWVEEGSGKICITDANFVKPRSKKADIETGEDQKGE